MEGAAQAAEGEAAPRHARRSGSSGWEVRRVTPKRPWSEMKPGTLIIGEAPKESGPGSHAESIMRISHHGSAAMCRRRRAAWRDVGVRRVGSSSHSKRRAACRGTAGKAVRQQRPARSRRSGPGASGTACLALRRGFSSPRAGGGRGRCGPDGPRRDNIVRPRFGPAGRRRAARRARERPRGHRGCRPPA